MGTGDRLRIESTDEDGILVILLEGELDLSTAPLLEEEFDKPQVRAAAILVLDLRELEFMDSTGLRAILAEHEHCEQIGRGFAITGSSDQVDRLLDVTRIAEHVRVVDSPEQAV